MRTWIPLTAAAAFVLNGAVQAQSVQNLAYVSGNAQIAAAGTALPAPLVVRNDSGIGQSIAWILENDSTGGARFSNGSTSIRLVPVGVGESIAESVVLGPQPGVVGLLACLTTATQILPGSNVDCDPTPAFGHIVAFAVGTPGADFGSALSGAIASGDLQSAAPGALLPNPITVRKVGTPIATAYYLIYNDTTGGANFNDGSTQATRLLQPGVTESIPVRLGPNPGELSVVICASDTALSFLACLNEEDPAIFIFAERAVGSGVSVQVIGPQRVGSTLTLSAPPAATSYEWDLDDDGVIDRVGSSNTLPVTYPGAFSGEVSVTAITSAAPAGAAGGKAIATAITTKQPITLLAPKLSVAVSGPLVEVCGNGDGVAQPGKRFRVPVTITNVGNFTTVDGYANFVAKDRYDAAVAGNGIAGKMAVETPQIGVGALAAGASMSSSVTVTMASDAACGSTYGLLFTGGVDLFSSAVGRSTALVNFAMPAAAQCQVFTGSCPATQPKAAIAPRQGLYLNPNRSGNGVSVHAIQVAGSAPVYFGLWFTGNADHSPDWYALQAPLVGNVAVSPILHYRQIIGAPSFQVESTTVGTAVIAMLGTERMLFAWQIGNRSGTELMNYFVGGPLPSPNRTGAWYNPSQSGSGQVIHQYVQNNVAQTFAIQFIYDAAGQPRWSLGQDTTAALIGGSAQTTYRVHCPGCPWIADWNGLPLAAGSASLVLDDPRNGRFSSSIVFPAPFNGTWTRSNLPIAILSDPQN